MPDTQVWIAENGRLYLSGGLHRAFDHALGIRVPRARSFAHFGSNIRSRAAFCAQAGIVYRHFVYPDKHTVELETIEGRAYLPLMERYRQACGDIFASPVTALRTAPLPTYLRTDTHWNGHGQIIAGLETARSLGVPECELALWRPALETQLIEIPLFHGDLGRKLQPAQSETAVLARKLKHVHNSESKADQGSEKGVIRIACNRQAPDRSLVMFGDSFGRGLVHCIAPFFRNVVFFRSRFMRYEILEWVRPTHVATATIERHLADVEADEIEPLRFQLRSMAGRHPNLSARFAAHYNAMLAPGTEGFAASRGLAADLIGRDRLEPAFLGECRARHRAVRALASRPPN